MNATSTATHLSPTLTRRRACWLLWFLVLAACLWGCSQSEELGETEASEIDKIFKTGVAHPDDPYVRAETMRVIELLSDPALASYAQQGLKDDSPMVRLAALRATLATSPEEGERAAAQVFSRGTTDEKLAVLGALSSHEMGPEQRELLARALRSREPQLRRIAFGANYIRRVEEAVAAKNEKLLEATLYPELGRFIGIDKDPVLAAMALRKFLDLGQANRADVLIKALGREDLPKQQRIDAARILLWAQAEPALEPFRAIVKRYDDALADRSLGVPTDLVPAELLRLAVLGTVAAGDQTHVSRAQKYMNNVDEKTAVEVLNAFGPNESPDAAMTLKVAMQDARRDVRLRAIELYRQRKDADPQALIAALEGADFETQKRLTKVLLERFREPWIAAIRSQIQRTSAIDIFDRIVQLESGDYTVGNVTRFTYALANILYAKKESSREIARINREINEARRR